MSTVANPDYPQVLTRKASAKPLLSPLAANLNLTRELAVTSFKLKYTGSALGYLWSLIKPLLIFGMMYLVFAVFLLRGAAGDKFPVQLLLGVVVWTFFADATSGSISAIAGNGNMIRKAYFPRWILVIASTLSSVMTLGVNVALILVIGLALGWFQVGVQSLMVIPLLIELYLLVIGIGLLFSSLFTFYRDLGHIWEIILQLLFFGSAIVYPVSFVPAHYQQLLFFSPTTQIIEDLRHALVTPHIAWSWSIAGIAEIIPLAAVAATFALGAVVFRAV